MYHLVHSPYKHNICCNSAFNWIIFKVKLYIYCRLFLGIAGCFSFNWIIFYGNCRLFLGIAQLLPPETLISAPHNKLQPQYFQFLRVWEVNNSIENPCEIGWVWSTTRRVARRFRSSNSKGWRQTQQQGWRVSPFFDPDCRLWKPENPKGLEEV